MAIVAHLKSLTTIGNPWIAKERKMGARRGQPLRRRVPQWKAARRLPVFR